MNLCNGNGGYGWGSSGGGGAISGCQGLPAGNISFFLGNSGATANGAYGFNSTTARVTGYTNGVLELQGTSAISMLNAVTMNSNKITSLAAGTISSASMDAVNGSQLYGLAASTASALGGGSVVNSNGSISNPSYVVGGSTFNNVGGALTNLDGRVTQNATNITTLQGNVTTINGQITNLQGKLADAVLYDSSAHTSVTLGGTGTTTGVALHNVANGTLSAASTDAVNGSQLYATNTNVTNLSNTVNNINNGGGIKYFHANSTLADSSAAGTNSVAIGPTATASGTGDIAIGVSAVANNNTTQTNSAVAIGNSATASASQTVALGGYSTASGAGATALGIGSTASGGLSSALGHYSVASGTNATAIGEGAVASSANSVALGQGSVANSAGVATASGVIGGTTYTYAGGSPAGVVSVGTASAQRQITNVAAGQVTATSTDAVNGSQLYAADTQITANTNSITTLNGQVTTLQGNVTTINGQVTTLQGNVTTINGQITNMQGQLANAVLYDSSAHNSVTLGGTGASSAVALHNVANGALSASSLDAVNGSQLYATNTNVSNLAGNVTTLQGNVTTLQGNVSTINSQITNINGKLQDAVLYDSSAHNSVTLGGSGASSAVALHNVANGTLSASSLDAVNGSQLYATNTNVSNLAGNVTTIQGNISTLAGDITNINGQMANTVQYDSSAHDSITLGGSGSTTAVAIHNVANGALSASSTDAVNGSQLYATNTNVSNLAGDVTTINGQITNMQGQLADAVLYDSSAHNSVTLGGSGASSAVALHNVANGTLSASSLDAVNGSQLYATNTNVSNLAGNVTTLAGDVTTIQGNISTLAGDITNINGQMANTVQYDSSAHDSITLGGSGSTTAVAIHNVANGALSESSTDAVNGSQLYATNQSISDLAGDITSINGQLADAVLYDSSAHDSLTLGGSGAAPVALHNVANGEISASSFDAVNGSQLYNTASSTASALG
uniref:beta strand repeat-containing protein n=1 Tax=Paraburkholderia bannensis TaxID=765414 RepID=UPI0038B87CB0